MVNSDPARTPTFTAFGDPNYFITNGTVANPNANPSCGSNPCIDYHFAWSHGDIQPVIGTTWMGMVGPGVASGGIDYHFAWSHGDIQPVIGTTWMGMVGPGVASGGIDSTTWTDHTNVRPTMLTLLGLSDDYIHDGHVILEALTTQATPQTLIAHRET